MKMKLQAVDPEGYLGSEHDLDVYDDISNLPENFLDVQWSVVTGWNPNPSIEDFMVGIDSERINIIYTIYPADAKCQVWNRDGLTAKQWAKRFIDNMELFSQM